VVDVEADSAGFWQKRMWQQMWEEKITQSLVEALKIPEMQELFCCQLAHQLIKR